MVGKIKYYAHFSQGSCDDFFGKLERHITEAQAQSLNVEVQYQTTMQPDGQAVFSAILLGRELEVR